MPGINPESKKTKKIAEMKLLLSENGPEGRKKMDAGRRVDGCSLTTAVSLCCSFSRTSTSTESDGRREDRGLGYTVFLTA